MSAQETAIEVMAAALDAHWSPPDEPRTAPSRSAVEHARVALAALANSEVLRTVLVEVLEHTDISGDWVASPAEQATDAIRTALGASDDEVEFHPVVVSRGDLESVSTALVTSLPCSCPRCRAKRP